MRSLLWMLLVALSLGLAGCGPADARAPVYSPQVGGSAAAGGTTIPEWTALTGGTLANMSRIDNFVTSVTESPAGTYTLGIDYTQNRTFPSNADSWSIANDFDQDPITEWAALTDPWKYALEVRTALSTGYDNNAGDPYVGIYVQDTATAPVYEYGIAIFDVGSGTIESYGFTQAAAAMSSGGNSQTADTVYHRTLCSLAQDRGGFNWGHMSGDTYTRTNPFYETEAGEIYNYTNIANLDITLFFQQLVADSGTGSVVVDLDYRFVQVFD